MLLEGFNHVAVLTGDTDRFVRFYGEMFDATSQVVEDNEGLKLTMVKVGPTAELNVFEVTGNTESERQVPMFGRGRLDHLALEAASIDAFETARDRLVACGASDGFVTDFGPILSLFYRDPDGLEAEVCVTNPDAQPGVTNPPGTPSRRYHPDARALNGATGLRTFSRHPWRQQRAAPSPRAERLPRGRRRSNGAPMRRRTGRSDLRRTGRTLERSPWRLP